MRNLTEIAELIRSGQKTTAHSALIEFIAMHPKDDQAWLYLASCAKDKAEFTECIQTVLGINPNEPTALKLAQKHGIQVVPSVMTPVPQAVVSKSSKSTHPKKSSHKSSNLGLWLAIFVLLVAMVGFGGAFFFLAADRANEETSTTYQTQEAEIVGTNAAQETAVYQQLAEQNATLSAP